MILQPTRIIRRKNIERAVELGPARGPEDTIEWVKGTLLTDYQQRMSPEMYQRYLAAYRERLLPRLGDSRPYFYPFKRVLLWARK